MALIFFMATDAQAQDMAADAQAQNMAADAQAQEGSDKDSCCYEDSCCVYGKNFYVKFFSGPNFLQKTAIDGNYTTYNTGYIVDGSLGFCWRRYGLRLEAEYAFRRNAISEINFFLGGSSENGHCQSSSYMGNLLWGMPLSSWWCSGSAFWKTVPFIGAGLGYNFQQLHSSNSRIVFNQKWKQYSWQAMAGLAYPIFCNAEITLEYKFHQGGSHFYNHSVGVGLVYNFGFLR